jgi:hypothetical protein
MSRLSSLVLVGATFAVGCLDDLEPQPPETFCTFTRTVFQRAVLERLGVNDAEVAARRCRDPEETEISSPLRGVPDAAIEPAVNIIAVELLYEVGSEIAGAAYPCGAGGEPAGELAICGAQAGPAIAGSTIATFETDEPLPLADPGDHYLVGFGFDGDGLVENNTTPADSPDDFHLRIDRWIEATYRPGDGWSLASFAFVAGEVIELDSESRLVIDGPVAALIVPAFELEIARPPSRIFLLRHTGDFGAAPPHDWSGYLFPTLSEPLF